MSEYRLITPGPDGDVVGEYYSEFKARLAAPAELEEFGVDCLELQHLENGLHGYDWYTIGRCTAPPKVAFTFAETTEIAEGDILTHDNGQQYVVRFEPMGTALQMCHYCGGVFEALVFSAHECKPGGGV